MKRTLWILVAACLLLLTSPIAWSQASLPNLSYSAILNTTCSNTNTACSGAIVAGQGGVPALPQANTGSLGTGNALDVPVPNYNAAVVTVNGTYAGSTINFEVADSVGGSNYYQIVCARSDINLLETSEVLPSNTTREWNCPVWGSYRFRVRQSAYTSGSVNIQITLTQAAIDPSLVVAASITNIAGASDPCADVSAIKSSAFANITTSTTTQLVALSAGKSIYICSTFGTNVSTTSGNTFILEYGTGSTCGTGTTSLSPTYTFAIAGTTFNFGGAYSMLTVPSGNALCLLSTVGATPNINITVTYVQQ